MVEDRKQSVGLVVVTELPGLGRVAVLQRRGVYNLEKGKPESWPGGCQVTVHGRCKEGESPDVALLREADEEFGPYFAGYLAAFLELGLVRKLPPVEGRTETVYNFSTEMRWEVLQRTRLGSDSGGIAYLRSDGVHAIEDLRRVDREMGIVDRNVFALFDDEKEVAIAALLA